MARAAPSPVGSGALMWNASPVIAPPATSAMIRAPRALGVLGRLDGEHGGPLAEDEPVALGVEGPRCCGRVVVALRERAHVGQRGERDRQDGALGAAGEDHLGVAVLDQALRVDERLHARGAGRDRWRSPARAGRSGC